MREIKFRVWNDYSKHYTSLSEAALYGIIKPYGNELKNVSNTEMVIEQFTGLKDKNGKEIYEGDIIKSNWNRFDGEYIGENYVVKFGEFYYNGGYESSYGGYGYYAESIHDQYNFGASSLNNIPCNQSEKEFYDIEIIGNIHENEDLLK